MSMSDCEKFYAEQTIFELNIVDNLNIPYISLYTWKKIKYINKMHLLEKDLYFKWHQAILCLSEYIHKDILYKFIPYQIKNKISYKVIISDKIKCIDLIKLIRDEYIPQYISELFKATENSIYSNNVRSDPIFQKESIEERGNRMFQYNNQIVNSMYSDISKSYRHIILKMFKINPEIISIFFNTVQDVNSHNKNELDYIVYDLIDFIMNKNSKTEIVIYP